MSLWCLPSQTSFVAVLEKQIWCYFLSGQLHICALFNVLFASLPNDNLGIWLIFRAFYWSTRFQQLIVGTLLFLLLNFGRSSKLHIFSKSSILNIPSVVYILLYICHIFFTFSHLESGCFWQEELSRAHVRKAYRSLRRCNFDVWEHNQYHEEKYVVNVWRKCRPTLIQHCIAGWSKGRWGGRCNVLMCKTKISILFYMKRSILRNCEESEDRLWSNIVLEVGHKS